jgi:C1A family cysteine protease
MLERNPHRYGWVPSLPDHRDCKLVHGAAKIAARPPSFDMTPKMPPPYDQGQVGSCTGNSSAAAFQYAQIKQGLPSWIPSRLFAYLNGRRAEGTVDTDAGAQLKDVVRGIATYGIVPETEWPYDENKWMDIPDAQVYTDALKNVATSYLAVRQTVDDICTTLAGNEPVIFGFSVYSAFESQQVAETGILNLPTASEQLLGGHAVLAVGYDDASQRFRVRNSWGPGWGQQGYFTIPYDYLSNPDLADDFWILRTVD